MNKTGLYHQAHLIAAAIRIIEYRNQRPPSDSEIFGKLSFSVEQGNRILKKMNDMGIVDMASGKFGTRVFLVDHLKIEDIPQDEDSSSLQDEIEKFKQSRKGIDKSVEAFKAKKAKRQQDLFAEMENKLKQDFGKKDKS